MDNIIMKKCWQEDSFIEFEMIAESEYIKAYQICYVDKNEFEKNLNSLKNYLAI